LSRTGKLAGKLSETRLLFTSEADRARASNDVQSFVAPVGVDISRVEGARARARERLGIKDDTDLLVCAIDERSSGVRLTAAMRTLALLAERHPRLRLVVIGADEDADDTRMHAAALGVTTLVRFLGPRSDASEICAAADAGWVAAEGDEASFACLDFMAGRVPVIAERSTSVSQFVPDGIAGILLAPADASDTAAAVARLLVDKNTRTTLGNGGYTRVTRDFTEQAMIEGFAAAAGAT
jgi:glycosyltransferase involved in cell wall biosynthesis